MNENGKKKREWIKTAAIVFLAVMLVLTFFSNTFMNYSLPEVATQYVSPGTITAKIRGTGVVESGDPYEVKVTESRKVASVAVRAGDQVEKGDVILYLEDAESEELKAAQAVLDEKEDALQAAEDAFDRALLTEDYTAQDIQQADGSTPVVSYRQQLTDAQNKVAQAQQSLADRDKSVAKLDTKIEDVNAQIAYEEVRQEAAKNKLDSAAASYDEVSGGDAAAAAPAKEALEKAQKEYDEITSQIENLKLQKSSLELDRYNVQKSQASATKALEAAQKELDDLKAMLGNILNLDDFQKAISDAREDVAEAQKEVDKLSANSIGATVNADISGTVTAVNVVAGNMTSADTPVAVLQPEGKGYTMSFSVTNEQSRRLSVGDRADLVNAWRYDEVDVVLSGIKPDLTEPGQKKLLTFDITGNVTPGQTLNVSVGQKSADFDCIVPNSAIREDNNGKFILIVESRPSPLGNRYYASRVDVEVLASDDTQSAVSGALYGYEIMSMRHPLITRTYLDYSCWWFAVFLGVTALLAVTRGRSGLKIAPGDSLDFLAVWAVCVGGILCFYIMRGAGIADYKCSIAATELWTLWALYCMGSEQSNETELSDDGKTA